MKPKIIVIGGTFGVGKTTLAHTMANKLNIYQRVGLGVIAKTLKYMSPDNSIIKNWSNYENYKTEEDLVKKLHQESELVGNILSVIINKAIYTEEACVIDGVQLLPEYLPLDDITFFVLELADKTMHEDRFTKPNKTKHRHLNNATLDVANLYQNVICKSAGKYGIPVYTTNISEDVLADKIIVDLDLN